jgi:hypothetical protein
LIALPIFASEIEKMTTKTIKEKPYVGSFKTSHALAKKVRIKCAKEGTTLSAKVEELLKEYTSTK